MDTNTTPDFTDARAVANHIFEAIAGAERPVFSEQLSARPGLVPETEYAVRVGAAIFYIGPDQQYPGGLCWSIHAHGETWAYGGWAVDDTDSAGRDVGEIIRMLTELGGGQ